MRALRLVRAMRTGLWGLDRWRGKLAIEILTQCDRRDIVPTAELARSLMGIVWMESRGAPGQVGDKDHKNGPSIGLMQVSRATAKDLKLWRPEPIPVSEFDQFKALAGQDQLCIRWGVFVFFVKLAVAKGDIPKAVRLYNGSGPRAEAYRDSVLRFIAQTWRI